MAEKRVLNKSVVLTIRTTPEIREKIEDLAARENRTSTNWVETMILREHDRMLREREIEAQIEAERIREEARIRAERQEPKSDWASRIK